MNIQETITERIIEALDKGVVPWRKDWNDAGGFHLPRNYASKKPYRGINVLLLSCTPFASPYWMTYKQVQEAGGHVRKGEKGTAIVFWKTLLKQKDGEEKADRIPLARQYTVFNLEQCEGITVPVTTASPDAVPVVPVDAAQSIADTYFRFNSSLSHGGDRAFYRPITDSVVMPPMSLFNSAEGYYSTLYHEMTHSTGHSTRLNRGLDVDTAPFGSEVYSKEELVAEFGAAFLCAEAGISNESLIVNHTAYIQSWLRALKNDKALAMSAAQKAQRAADFILNRTFEDAAEVSE